MHWLSIFHSQPYSQYLWPNNATRYGLRLEILISLLPGGVLLSHILIDLGREQPKFGGERPVFLFFFFLPSSNNLYVSLDRRRGTRNKGAGCNDRVPYRLRPLSPARRCKSKPHTMRSRESAPRLACAATLRANTPNAPYYGGIHYPDSLNPNLGAAHAYAPRECAIRPYLRAATTRMSPNLKSRLCTRRARRARPPTRRTGSPTHRTHLPRPPPRLPSNAPYRPPNLHNGDQRQLEIGNPILARYLIWRSPSPALISRDVFLNSRRPRGCKSDPDRWMNKWGEMDEMNEYNSVKLARRRFGR
ncbi:hypothetical protein C8R44DRAFT_857740 [Mycena epipterygia]|nr:hypothetical protein C8R44DRAFT_857740 [Mycena epipterygia]